MGVEIEEADHESVKALLRQTIVGLDSFMDFAMAQEMQTRTPFPMIGRIDSMRGRAAAALQVLSPGENVEAASPRLAEVAEEMGIKAPDPALEVLKQRKG
jgi:hypothetical protein